MSQEHPAVVIDNGSYQCKAGIEDDKKCCFYTAIGKPKLQGSIFARGGQKIYIGNEIQDLRSILQLKYPIDEGIINNFDDMECIWHHILFDQLKVQPEDHPVLLTEVPMNPKYIKEKMIQIMFEQFDVPKFQIAQQAVLSLYTQGRTTGIVVNSGYDVTHIVPIYECDVLEQGIGRSELAGRACTKNLDTLLNEYSVLLSSSSRMEIVGDIKEQLCYVALDYQQEMKKQLDRSYKLPDHNTIFINKERFKCPELLFNPNLFDQECLAIHQVLQKSIMKSDIDFRREFYENIVLSGGNTLFTGFADRLKKELLSITSSKLKINIYASREGKFSALVGGWILSSLSTFKNHWITRAQYDEYGPFFINIRRF